MTKFEDNPSPYLTMLESAAPGTPASGLGKIYEKTDGKPYFKNDSGTEYDMSGTTAGGTTSNFPCQGRLTLTTAVPVTTADVTAATSVYFTPFRGNQIATYSGTAWALTAFTEKTLSLAGLTADSNYDIFIVDSTLALEALIWTNNTTRATAIVLQDGVYVKSGATTRRYLGTIRITSAGGQCEDSDLKRYVFNYYNQVERELSVVDTTNSWTYAVATWRQARATAGNKVEYVCGVSERPVKADVLCNTLTNSAAYSVVGVGIDSTSVNSSRLNNKSYGGAGTADRIPVSATYRGYPGIGYHYIAWLESSPSGTSTFEGDDGDTWEQSGLVAEVLG